MNSVSRRIWRSRLVILVLFLFPICLITACWIPYVSTFGGREEISCNVTKVIADCPRICHVQCVVDGSPIPTSYKQSCTSETGPHPCNVGDGTTFLYKDDGRFPLLTKYARNTWLTLIIVVMVILIIISCCASMGVYVSVDLTTKGNPLYEFGIQRETSISCASISCTSSSDTT
jgi:hypothetical protein